ncbi:tyrosine-type recombinase/integrase [Rhodococcoides kroppenstedtii]|uniref:tyrosine-type recombinase/integrase n=1 Tax=Rhodococcoides kroppenstedtii TaxID=293050 RepID=UPI001BDEC37A|nr:site-specific integrase [Rhodococcus kroppenstedtii]MBT1191311.1 site-specific integrase [Rhodococcus kroppenstedtii]
MSDGRRRATGRRRGKGSITSYQTAGGVRWRWQLRVPLDPEDPDAGDRQTGKGGYLTASDADDGLDEAKRKLRQRLTFSRSMPTVAEHLEAWVGGRQLERSTLVSYRRLVRVHIVPELGDIPLDRLTANRIATHYRQLSVDGRRDVHSQGKPLSANTIAKIHAVLAAALDVAVSDGLIAVSPARKRTIVQPPTGRKIRAQRPEMAVWTAAQLSTFLAWCETQGDPLHPLWTFIAYTGTRRSEALAVMWRDVDLDKGRVTIRRALDTTQRDVVKLTKSGGARVIDLDAGTTAILRTWRRTLGGLSIERAKPDAFVFGTVREGRPRSPNDVSRSWRRRNDAARAELGADAVPAIRLHDLRHTHASLLLALGVPVKVVSERLGHASATITLDVYSHVMPGQGRAAADMLAAAVRTAQ